MATDRDARERALDAIVKLRSFTVEPGETIDSDAVTADAQPIAEFLSNG